MTNLDFRNFINFNDLHFTNLYLNFINFILIIIKKIIILKLIIMLIIITTVIIIIILLNIVSIIITSIIMIIIKFRKFNFLKEFKFTAFIVSLIQIKIFIKFYKA